MTAMIEGENTTNGAIGWGREGAPSSGGNGQTAHRWTKRQKKLRDEMIAEAATLFRLQGFDETSIAQIADIVGISTRTFFRYFKTKEDLAFGWLDQHGEDIRSSLAEKSGGDTPSVVLRAVLLKEASREDVNQDSTKFLIRMIYENANLTGRFRAYLHSWEEEYVQALATPQMKESDIFQLRVRVAVISAAYGIALKDWSFKNFKGPLLNRVKQAFQILDDE